jgi:serine/threonine-protein kinase
MELLEGEDLGAVIERGPLPIADSVDLLLQACEAVAEAHALGIVHRDLKPRNLFLTAKLHGKPLVKVLDFGLAKRVDMQDRQLTQTTAVMGSPQYMSPEQMKGPRGTDFRTDVWSSGASRGSPHGVEVVEGRELETLIPVLGSAKADAGHTSTPAPPTAAPGAGTKVNKTPHAGKVSNPFDPNRY